MKHELGFFNSFVLFCAVCACQSGKMEVVSRSPGSRQNLGKCSNLLVLVTLEHYYVILFYAVFIHLRSMYFYSDHNVKKY